MKRIPWVVSAWIGSLAVAPLVWWLLGDVSQLNGVRRSWSVPEWLLQNTRLFGVAAAVTIVSVAAFEFVGLRLNLFARHMLTVFVPLMCAAALAAFNFRVMTALTPDTNIGGAVALLLGMPVALGLTIVHLFLLRDQLRRERFVRRR